MRVSPKLGSELNGGKLMGLEIPSSADWAMKCCSDGEFCLAARYWSGGINLEIGDRRLSIQIDEGKAMEGESAEGALTFKAPEEFWSKMLSPIPPRFYNEMFASLNTGKGVERSGDHLTQAQYYSAVMRAIELLRPAVSDEGVIGNVPTAGISPVGRYINLPLGEHVHRLYYEEYGQGIPVLMQHTAGCHGSQWRHLFECSDITDHFRLIAYDLPFHGKSLPPTSQDWWAETYDLGGQFLRSVPLGLAEALNLSDPVFMGCSVGGLLALDLAQRHPDVFKAVISVEGSLKVEGDRSESKEFYHPQVSSEYKARMMEGLTSPTSPKALVKETSFVYASGWPPVFIGDLKYYIEDYDLRDQAGTIDTNRVGVHILSGEYDWSGTSELGKAASNAIPGSTWQEMKGVGHFPMSENPEAFISYLLPILQTIRNT